MRRLVYVSASTMHVHGFRSTLLRAIAPLQHSYASLHDSNSHFIAVRHARHIRTFDTTARVTIGLVHGPAHINTHAHTRTDRIASTFMSFPCSYEPFIFLTQGVRRVRVAHRVRRAAVRTPELLPLERHSVCISGHPVNTHEFVWRADCPDHPVRAHRCHDDLRRFLLAHVWLALNWQPRCSRSSCVLPCLVRTLQHIRYVFFITDLSR
ncbi:hypothetical protein SCLCIDRAFT_614536 [Scleroderma citrinum Foug A]|uniref:Uncharacterized protein n=1 Tax=Scleroderma citrinum Foug A TaxID=1036808 RepID=A0A0C3E8H7_9AGAM|nr:hypothetical protein SCLCIDRAFT_614536 [Scleroderma citrinum Foug A]